MEQHIRWEAIDSSSAKATMKYKDISGSVVFHFNEQADIIGCSADRYKDAGRNAVLEKWIVTTKETGVFNGIKMPVKSEVMWQLKSGDFTWYKLEIIGIEYNKPALY